MNISCRGLVVEGTKLILTVFVLTVQCGTMLLREISRRVHLTEAARYEVTGSVNHTIWIKDKQNIFPIDYRPNNPMFPFLDRRRQHRSAGKWQGTIFAQVILVSLPLFSPSIASTPCSEYTSYDIPHILTTVIVVPVDCKLPEQNVPLCPIFLLKQYTTRHCPVDKWTADTTSSEQKGVCRAQFAGEEKSPSRIDKYIFTQGEKCAKKKSL
uniref:Uncharacterized protein n=1 Tax=Echinococcus canadensis TaxID=519352 RepID=A0A915ET44_9CEST